MICDSKHNPQDAKQRLENKEIKERNCVDNCYQRGRSRVQERVAKKKRFSPEGWKGRR